MTECPVLSSVCQLCDWNFRKMAVHSSWSGKVHQHAAILKHPVIGGELGAIALVHVDIVDAVARQETEVLVLRARLRSPALTEGVHQGVLVGNRPLHHAIELLVEVVVEAGDTEGQRPHLRAVEEIASDEVECS